MDISWISGRKSDIHIQNHNCISYKVNKRHGFKLNTLNDKLKKFYYLEEIRFVISRDTVTGYREIHELQ